MMRALAPYLSVIGGPGANRLVLASLGGRLSFGPFDLALVLLVERATGSFALAGLAVGLHAALTVLLVEQPWRRATAARATGSR